MLHVIVKNVKYPQKIRDWDIKAQMEKLGSYTMDIF